MLNPQIRKNNISNKKSPLKTQNPTFSKSMYPTTNNNNIKFYPQTNIHSSTENSKEPSPKRKFLQEIYKQRKIIFSAKSNRRSQTQYNPSRTNQYHEQQQQQDQNQKLLDNQETIRSQSPGRSSSNRASLYYSKKPKNNSNKKNQGNSCKFNSKTSNYNSPSPKKSDINRPKTTNNLYYMTTSSIQSTNKENNPKQQQQFINNNSDLIQNISDLNIDQITFKENQQYNPEQINNNNNEFQDDNVSSHLRNTHNNNIVSKLNIALSNQNFNPNFPCNNSNKNQYQLQPKLHINNNPNLLKKTYQQKYLKQQQQQQQTQKSKNPKKQNIIELDPNFTNQENSEITRNNPGFNSVNNILKQRYNHKNLSNNNTVKDLHKSPSFIQYSKQQKEEQQQQQDTKFKQNQNKSGQQLVDYNKLVAQHENQYIQSYLYENHKKKLRSVSHQQYLKQEKSKNDDEFSPVKKFLLQSNDKSQQVYNPSQNNTQNNTHNFNSFYNIPTQNSFQNSIQNLSNLTFKNSNSNLNFQKFKKNKQGLILAKLGEYKKNSALFDNKLHSDQLQENVDNLFLKNTQRQNNQFRPIQTKFMRSNSKITRKAVTPNTRINMSMA